MKNSAKFLFLFVFLFAAVSASKAQASLYDQAGEFFFCKNVTDDVQPIDPVTEITAGTPVHFLFKMNSPMLGPKDSGRFTVGWVIHSVGDDGKENGYIEQYMTGFDKGYRRYCTDVPYTFSKPGKYSVTVIDWYDVRNNNYGGDYDYFWSKGIITVK